MIKNKICKIILSITVAIMMIAIVGTTVIFAADSTTAKLSKTRWIKNSNNEYTNTEKAYALNSGNSHPLFQILSIDGTDKVTGTNYYCLNASKGATWMTNNVGEKVVFDKSYDLVAQKDEIANSSLVNTYKNVVSTNYGKLMWVLDNMYKEDGLTIEQLLANAGIVKGDTEQESPYIDGTIHAYYYDSTVNPSSKFSTDINSDNRFYGNAITKGYYYIDNGEVKDVILSKELVEAVQQAVIWYFTNNSEYNCYTTSYDNINWLQYATNLGDDTNNWPTISNQTVTNSYGSTINTGIMLQEQAAILYNYLVDGANEAGNNYVGTSDGTIKIEYTGTSQDSKITEKDSNYIIGPLKITTTGSITVKNIEVKSGTNTIDGQVTDSNGNSKTLKANENFYVKVAKSDVTDKLKITANSNKYVITDKKLWIKEVTQDENAEQPIVEVKGRSDEKSSSIEIPLNKQFDLALRKTIVKIVDSKGNTKSILNENGNPAVRTNNPDGVTIDVDPNTIPETAKYKHRKDPVVITTGDVVTYRITVYNEGEIDGYASKIVDQLPTGLESVLKKDGTVTSHSGNVYKVTEYDTTANKLVLSIDTTKTITSIGAFNSTTVKNDYIEVDCKVTGIAKTDGKTKQYLTNIAYIAEEYDKDGNQITADRDGNESKPTNSPNKTAEELNSSDANNYKGDSSNKSVYSDTNNEEYYKGQEDDDDFEKVVLLPKKFDLALRKFITKISGDGKFNTVTEINPSRAPKIDSSKLKAGTADTAIYNHSKEPIMLNAGDYILYTLRAYNEGDLDGYASQIIDYLPENLDFVDSTDEYIKSINDKWTYDSATRKVTTKTDTANATTKLAAFDAQNDDGKGSGLSYVDVQIVCKVNKKAAANKKLTNIAEISEYKDEEGNVVEKDRDSSSDNLDYPENPETYKDNEINKEYVPGQEDDDDFEKVIVKEEIVDLALTKFITAVSTDTKIEDGEYLTPNKNIGSKTNEYIRATVADTTGLKAGTSTNATYTAKKDIEPLVVSKNSYVLYNIRVYNEGEVDVFAGEITDYLPENLEFVDGEFNKQYGWSANGQTVKTTYLSSANGEDKILKAFDKENDDGKGSGLDYKDLPILCRVSDKAESGKKMVNTAEITKYEDEDGNELPKDIDSTPENKEEKNVEERDEDDDDYEVVIIKDFDLALRKFITTIEGKDIDSRIPQLSYENGKITYTHPKDVLRTTVGDVVIYTLRVFNEGDIAGYAQEISDDIPEHLEFLPENATNREYKWVMYDKDGKSTTKVSDAVRIKTDYTSKENGELLMKSNNQTESDLSENPNLLHAFDKTAGITDTNPDYVDVKVAFKVKDPNSNKTVIVNKAQISEDADENGNPVDDIDSIPDKWNDGEDDQDYENVAVDYFDLSLLKYVTKTIVTENGKTKTTKTGNNGSDKDITPKVEVYRKSLNKTIVKFEYTIKITNEGDIAGYAKEITDYVPKGLKFYKEDNKGWKDEGNNVISTELLKNTLLKPGQSATVKVILRWINGENNLGIKTNVAEISKDYNEKGVPDRDSTPDNKKKGEDDIDDAPVLLTISTGMLEHTIQYVAGALVVLVVLGTGLVVIKKYVL